MLREIAVGLGMVVLTTFIHALFMISGNFLLEWRLNLFSRAKNRFFKVFLVSGLTAWQFVAVIVEGFFWALLYLYNPCMRPLLSTPCVNKISVSFDQVS